MDKFSISLEGYHELCQVDTSLPRAHLVQNFAKEMDNQWDLKRTPGAAHGAELPFPLLLGNEICKCMANKEEVTKIKVKISGDGTKMSHSSNFFVCSFALIDDDCSCLSSAGNHTIAIVKGKEDHECLKESLANVINDVNSLVKDRKITVDGKTVPLEFYLGGDYKFLLIAMGMKGATSNNSCIWCKLHKNERCNMSHSCEYFRGEMARRVDSSWPKQPGCHSAPFFHIPIDNVILDELHLMLRITDRLEEGLILDILKWDTDDNNSRPSNRKKNEHLEAFLDAVRSLGVSFQVYKKNEKWEWTSLLGGEKRMLLRKLPNLFDQFLPPNKVEKTKSLWINFRELLEILNKEKIGEDDIKTFETKALSWGKEMVAMSGFGPGYSQTVIITPYMHCMIYHAPTMMRKHGSLRHFSGQGVEKKNDDLRRYFHRKINRWDAATNVLLVEKRQETLGGMERDKRHYQKRNNSFWLEGGKQEAARKVMRISCAEPEKTPPVPCMSEAVLKKKKVVELIALLENQTGRTVNKKTRKQDIITALLSAATRAE